MDVKTFSAGGIFAAYVVQIKLWIFLTVYSGRAQRASTDQLTHLYRCTDTHWNVSVLTRRQSLRNRKVVAASFLLPKQNCVTAHRNLFIKFLLQSNKCEYFISLNSSNILRDSTHSRVINVAPVYGKCPQQQFSRLSWPSTPNFLNKMPGRAEWSCYLSLLQQEPHMWKQNISQIPH